jgi:pimeloyl-ACP methyl ester carboxylesterase
MEGTVDGVFYRYRPGRGRPVIFLHGWLGSMNSWNRVRYHADLPNPELVYDQRCHGCSTTEVFAFSDLAADLQLLIERFDLQNAVIAGHSMGGMVALAHAAEYGGHPLFLAGTCASTPEPADGSPRFFLEELGAMEREEWAERIASNYAPEGRARRLAERELREADRAQLEHPLRAMIDWDVRGRLDHDQEAVIVAGREDGAVTAEKTRELASILDAPHRTVEGSHLMLQERPGTVAEELDAFFHGL